MTSSGFWKNAEPQVLLVQSELCAAAFPHEIACRLPYHQVHGVWRRTRHNPWRCSTTPSQRLQKDFRDVGLRGWTVLLGCKTTAATVFFLQHFCQGRLGKMPHVRVLQPWFVAPQAKHDIFSILSGLQANSSKAYWTSMSFLCYDWPSLCHSLWNYMTSITGHGYDCPPGDPFPSAHHWPCVRTLHSGATGWAPQFNFCAVGKHFGNE